MAVQEDPTDFSFCALGSDCVATELGGFFTLFLCQFSIQMSFSLLHSLFGLNPSTKMLFTMVCLCWSMLFEFSISLVLENKAGLATISAVMLLDKCLMS